MVNDLMVFRAWIKEHRNMMTPRILATRKVSGKDVFVELSEGEGFDHKPIYGVSVFHRSPEGVFKSGEDSRSQMFHDKDEAKKHYRSIK